MTKLLCRTELRTPASLDIVKDRRFEQLIECVLCGVHVPKHNEIDSDAEAIEEVLSTEHIEEVLSSENPNADDGLSIRDACRAAWGIAILGTHRSAQSIGGVNVLVLLDALSVRVRNLLLGRVQMLRQDDLIKNEFETIEERLDNFSEELAEDAASAMWAFACVTACTGTSYPALFDICASILCQDPFDVRKRAQDIEATLETLSVGSNDAVERLARSEIESAMDHAEDDTQRSTVREPRSAEMDQKDALLDWLSPNELTDVIWAVALHDGKNETANAHNLTLNMETFCEIAFERAVSWLQKDLDNAQRARSTIGNTTGIHSNTEESFKDVQSSADVASAVSNKGEAPFEGSQQQPTDAIDQDAIPIASVEEWVQTVDASAILASEASDNSPSVNSIQQQRPEDIVREDELGHGPLQDRGAWVNAVDASASLESEAPDDTFPMSANSRKHVEPADASPALESKVSCGHDSSFVEQQITQSSDLATDEEGDVVEVVDAATIIASELSETSVRTSLQALQQEPTVAIESDDMERVLVVEMVDASTILQSQVSGNSEKTSFEWPRAHSEKAMELKDAVRSPTRADKASALDQFESPTSKTNDGMTSSSPSKDLDPGERVEEVGDLITSSPRDLACLAWAATELHDPLRSVLVQLVKDSFVLMGQDSLKALTGSGVSNLAWAIAKYQSRGIDVAQHNSVDLMAGWIAENALDYSELGESDSPSSMVLKRFHPPELSRLVWSLASVFSDRSAVECPSASSVDTLAYHALLTAATNLSVFGAEDLVSRLVSKS